MSRKFQCKAIPNTWLENNGRRLDCGPYMAGAFEAKEFLKKHHTEPLSKLTAGHNGGIYNGPQFVRNYVDDPAHGVPFLTTSTILQADMVNLPMISRKDAFSPKLKYLRVEEGMTLITCSGSIGRMVYVRKDMEGCWSNQDIMKVVADDKLILPGYLYAYLSSRFGVSIVVSGTYGAIVQHIEPHHITDLPVPRLGEIEDAIHNLINQSSNLRTVASEVIKRASARYLLAANIIDIAPNYWHTNSGHIGFASSVSKTSLRAMNYLPINKEIENLIRVQSPIYKMLGEITEPGTLRRGNIFKRIDAEPEYGVELIGQQEGFSLRPSGRWISKKYLPQDKLLFPPDGAIMIASQGCAGEHDLFGRALFVTGKRLRYAFSEHFLRVIPDENEIPKGALFAYLNSQIAYRIRKGYQIGSMQQDFHPDMIKQMPVPIIDRREALEIDAMVRAAYQKFDDAIEAEDQAIDLVEHAIEGGGI